MRNRLGREFQKCLRSRKKKMAACVLKINVAKVRVCSVRIGSLSR
jgi:hypothetical protein